MQNRLKDMLLVKGIKSSLWLVALMSEQGRDRYSASSDRSKAKGNFK